MGKEGVQVKAVWFGLTTALGIWVIIGVAGFLWVVVSEQTAYYLGMYLYLLGILGVLVGAVAAGKRSSGRGWLHGLWVGLLLGLFGIILNLELVPELYSWGAIGRQLLVWTLWGIAGGHLGGYFRSPERGKAEGIRRKFFSKER
jgi:putative membrane protein (TIGR04086 family)